MSAALPDSAEDQPRDPWERYGWVMGTIWLVFLLFPLSGVVFGEIPVWDKVAGVACVLAFAAVYVLGLVQSPDDDSWSGLTGWGARYVAALVALVVTAAALAGETALGMTPFVVAFAMFALPLRGGVAVLVGTMAVALTLPWAVESFANSWYAAPIVLTVGLSTATVRVLERRGAAHRILTDELTMAAERDRVARDVHDVIGHSLTVVTVKAELAERLVDIDPAAAREELVQIQSLTRQALAEIRATVAGLRVARLSDELESAAMALTGAGMAADLPRDPSVVDPRHRIVLAWTLREAVTNVVRHSGAERCRIRLGEDWLEVTDDGRGMDGHREGNGLRGLRERVRGAGGTVEVAAGSGGGGTTLRVSL